MKAIKSVSTWKRLIKKIIAVFLVLMLVCTEMFFVGAEEIYGIVEKGIKSAYKNIEYEAAKQEAKRNAVEDSQDEKELEPKEENEEEKTEEKTEPETEGETEPETELFPMQDEKESEDEKESYEFAGTKYKDEEKERLKELYGEPINDNEIGETYKVSDTEYITYISSIEDTFINERGEEEELDLTLKEESSVFSRGRMLSIMNMGRGEVIYEPKASEIEMKFPETITKHEGIKVTNEGKTLEIFPRGGIYEEGETLDNAIRYKDVYENIDVIYTAMPWGVKEDVILKERTKINEFYYEFNKEGLDVYLEEGEVHIREKGYEEDLFILSAPYMIDDEEEISKDITLSISFEGDICIVKVIADEKWLNEEERAYPVVIDPVITVPKSNLIQVTTLSYNNSSYAAKGYGYAGYIMGYMIATPGADFKRTRMYYKINYDFKNKIPKEAKINSATLNIYQYVHFESSDAVFQSSTIKESWNEKTLDWNKGVSLDLEPSGQNFRSPSKEGMHKFDIREAVNGWVQGTIPNYGIVIKAGNEFDTGGAFYTPSSNSGNGGQGGFTASKAPSITINWSVPDPVDINYSINNTLINLRPITAGNSDGKRNFEGVFADGIAKPGSSILYELSDKEKEYGGLVYASYSYKYPNSESFEEYFSKEANKYRDKEGNWQTVIPFTEAALNKKYWINAKAIYGETEGTLNSSESFVIYEVSKFDTISNLATYYGVPQNVIMLDNKVQDEMIVEGNTLFIRNPNENAEKPYTTGELTEDEKREIDYALMGRGLHCEYGLEPINLNTGNFFMEKTDISVPSYQTMFSIERTYNAKAANLNSMFGRGWSSEYFEKLSKDKDGSLLYKRSDGSIIFFKKEGSEYIGPKGYDLTLTANEIRKETYDFGSGEEEHIIYEYVIENSYKEKKTFNAYGSLIYIEDGKGNKETLNYDKEYKLESIENESGSIYKIKINKAGYIEEIKLGDEIVLKYKYDENGNLISYENAENEKETYEYNEKNQMISWHNGNGTKVIENTYDEKGRVISQVDGNKKISTLEYSEGETKVTDANGNTAIYHYDENYRTTKIEYPDGSAVFKEYNDENRLVKETNEIDSVTRYEYDKHGNITKITLNDGTYMSFLYNDQNQRIRQESYDGTVTEIEYDENHNVKEIKINGKIINKITADEYGRVLSQTDAKGNITTYEYEGANISKITDASGESTLIKYNILGQKTYIEDPMGDVTVITYDLQGRNTNTYFSDGAGESIEYDEAGYIRSIEDGEGNKTTLAYDGFGNIISMINPKGGEYIYTYDGVGNVLSIKNPEGRIYEYKYDKRDRLIEETDGEGEKTKYTLDKLGRIIKKERGEAAFTYTYENRYNNILTVTDNLGGTRENTYDLAGNLIKVDYLGEINETYSYDFLGNITSYKDGNGNITTYEYDEVGNLIKVKEGDRVSTLKYNSVNQVIEEVLPNGNSIKYTYDKRGNLETETDPMGGKSSYTYSSSGLLTLIVDPKGNREEMTYDNAGNMISYIGKAGEEIKIEYDALNMPEKEVDALGNVTMYEYNHMEELEKIIYANEGEEEIKYNGAGLPISYEDPNGVMTVKTYDALGNVKTVKEEDGGETKYTYDKIGQLVKVETEEGFEISYTYDLLGRVINEKDSLGKDTKFYYDNNGNLIKEIDAKGDATSYEYDRYDQLIKITYPNKSTNSFGYDSVGNLLWAKDEMGVTTKYSYDKNGNVINENTLGQSYKYTYDKLNMVISSTNPKEETTRYTYDLLGNVSEIIDANGEKEEYGYDLNGNLIFKKDKEGNESVFIYTNMNQLQKELYPEGASSGYEYDLAGNITKYIDSEGNESIYEYGTRNHLIKETMPDGGEYKYKYDLDGNLIEEEDPLGSITKIKTNGYSQQTERIEKNSAKFTYEYDELGRIKKTEGPNGTYVLYTYDNMGNLIKQTDQGNRSYIYSYDKAGNITKITDPNGEEEKYTYDKLGNLIEVTNKTGANKIYEYDSLNRVIGITKAGGLDVKLEYDKVGNVTRVTENEERETTFSHDKNSNLIKEVNPLGEESIYKYDGLGRLVMYEKEGAQKAEYKYDTNSNLKEITLGNNVISRYEYDSMGYIKASYDGENRKTEYTYDLLGRVTSAKAGTDENYILNQYTYDEIGNLISFTDGEGREYLYEYDLLGNLISEKDPLGNETKYEYDINQMLMREKLENGEYITYDYDKLDNLMSKEYSKEDEVKTLYGYDEEGKLISMEDSLGESTYLYDENGRITKVVQADGKQIQYKYDEYGNIKEIIYPDKSKVSYTYDKLDRLISVKDVSGNITTYSYDSLGNINEVLRGNETSTSLKYDEKERVVKISNYDKEGKTLSVYEYEYDNSDYITKEKIISLEKKETNIYTYDNIGQLKSVRKEDEKGNFIEEQTYGYDKSGNKISLISKDEKGSEVKTRYILDEGGRLVAKESETESTEYVYDKMGNRTQKIEDGEIISSYEYDMENRLIAVKDKEGLLMAALYDGLGNRMFTAERSTGTDEYKLFEEVKKCEKTENLNKTDVFFYGFGQSMFQGFSPNIKSGMMLWDAIWLDVIDYFKGNNRETKDKGSSDDDEPPSIVSEKDIEEEGKEILPMDVTLANGMLLIPYGEKEDEYNYYEVKNYVNDINKEHTEVLASYNQNGDTVEKYSYGNERINYIDERGDEYYYQYQAQGSVSVLTDEEGRFKTGYLYDSYGTYEMYGEATENPYTYNGEYTDKLTKNQYLRARYYEPSSGVFITKDTYTGDNYIPITKNGYTYANNNPINYIDPSGHKAARFGGTVKKLEEKERIDRQTRLDFFAQTVSIMFYEAKGVAPPETLVNARNKNLAHIEWSNQRCEMFKKVLSGGGHMVLDVLGMVPGIGLGADLINAAWYYAEGDVVNGSLALGAAIPGVGLAFGTGKIGTKIFVKGVPTNGITDAVGSSLDDITDIVKGADTKPDAPKNIADTGSATKPGNTQTSGKPNGGSTKPVDGSSADKPVVKGDDSIDGSTGKNVISAKDRKKLERWGENAPSDDIFLKYRDAYLKSKYFNQKNGKRIYPGDKDKTHKDGFLNGIYDKKQLEVGTRIDRYGGENGTFLAPENTPFEQRALPPDVKDKAEYYVYEVIKPLDVREGKTADWFGQPGGGTQYKTGVPIDELLGVYLRRIF